jgi:hypothetical protein
MSTHKHGRCVVTADACGAIAATFARRTIGEEWSERHPDATGVLGAMLVLTSEVMLDRPPMVRAHRDALQRIAYICYTLFRQSDIEVEPDCTAELYCLCQAIAGTSEIADAVIAAAFTVMDAMGEPLPRGAAKSAREFASGVGMGVLSY